MSNNKLNLLFQFTGIDKVSDNIKNIIGASKKGAESIRGMQREVTLMEKDLARIQRTMSKGGSQNGGLIMAERELKAAIEETNRSIERQQVRLARIENVKARATSLADGLGKAGAFASASITAPLGLVVASIDNLAERSKGMQNAANVSHMAFETFQRGAFAAKSVGIEYDKFGDILKDTQDKIGDFVANKGGEMADFFKNVAPKVHVTAKSFKNLSGADALQLYYNSLIKAGVSQKELVFYMEAIADEGSGLIPILANNGQKMKELGAQAAVISDLDAQGLTKYTEAQQRLGTATIQLQIALAKSGLIDALVWITTKGSEAAAAFGKLDPSLQRAAVAAGIVASAIGPVMLGFAGLVTAAAPIAPLFVASGTAAAASGVATGAAGAAAGGAAVGFGALAVAMLAIVAIPAIVIGAAMLIYTYWDQIKGAWDAGVSFIKTTFDALPAWMKNIGSMMMLGLLSALNPALLVTKLVGIAKTGVTAFKNYFGIKSPSRLFMEMGGHINDGLGIGLEKGKGRPVRAVGRMAGAVAGAGAMALSPAASARPMTAPAPISISITIQQLPGEDGEALAQRVLRLVQKAQAQDQRREFEDDF